MGDVLEFGDEMARRLDAMYVSGDVRRRRALATAALRLTGGESVLDVGCGPGFHVAELADIVGEQGQVTGIDPSAAMLVSAGGRNQQRDNVDFLTGTATDLPVGDDSFDAAISVQVLEYVGDVARALGELRRVLKSGGRLVVWDIDWSTLSWHSSDTQRMSEVMEVWDRHLVDPSLPRTLATSMRSAGFTGVEIEGHLFVNIAPDSDAYSASLIPIIEHFIIENGTSQQRAAAWRTDLHDLAATGRYFFSITQFCFSATRPA